MFVVENTDNQNPLVSAVYISSARIGHEREVVNILRVSRENNQRAGLTGLLAYKDGNFLQILEGPQSELMRTVDVIGRDRRHAGMIVLAKRRIEERLFPDWSMAFREIEQFSPEESDLCSRLLEDGLLEEKHQSKPDLCYQLLISFKKNMRYA